MGSAGLFWVSFYVGSPLIAFNVFTAFSIDVYCKLEELEDEDAEKKTEIEEDLTDKGLCLTITENSELAKERVYRAMFEEEDDDGEGSDKGDDNGDDKKDDEGA